MKGRNKLVLEEYLLRSKAVRTRILWGYDMAMVWTCACLALGLRLDPSLSSAPIEYAREVWEYGLLQMAVMPLAFYAGYLYATMQGASDIRETVQVLLACLVVALVQPVGILLLDTCMPRSYYMLRFVSTVEAAISGQVSFQVLRKITDKINHFLEENIPPRAMITGAGKTGTLIFKEMRVGERVHEYLVCIIDDNKGRQGRVIDGVSAVSNRRDIARLVREKGIDEIYVAISIAPSEDIRDTLKTYQGTGYQVKILPGVYQLVDGKVMILGLRKVKIEDLLGGESINISLDETVGYVKGKVVLVVGKGDSVGSELYRQLTPHKTKQLTIFDIHENNAYEIRQELKRKYPHLDLVVPISSIHNTNRLDYFFRIYRPDVVYHATAHKHMPLMEDSSNEVIRSNVLDIYKTAGAAIKYKVQRFTSISTDKAVNPTNIVGASKRLCEMVVRMSSQKSSTEFVAVRFGDVLGSNGSVISLFKQQIEDDGSVTMTHKDTICYFMTTPGAISLVIQTGVYARGGETFVLNMGDPVRILDMVESLICLSGYEPYKGVDVCFIGLRPGEKLYREPLMDEEGLQGTVNDRIFIGRPTDMDYDRFGKGLQRLGETTLGEATGTRELVHDLIPEYHYENMDSNIAAVEATASRDSEAIPVNPERSAVHKKIAIYNLGMKQGKGYEGGTVALPHSGVTPVIWLKFICGKNSYVSHIRLRYWKCPWDGEAYSFFINAV